MKTCSKCNTEKLLNEFNKCKSFKDGLQRYCRECSNKAHKEWYQKNKEKEKEESLNRYYLSKDYAKDKSLQRKYNITLEDQKKLLDKKQNGKCANTKCNKPWNATDHNHVSGLVRGLLCRECNISLGLLDDSFDKIIALAKYLHEAENIL